MINISIGKFSTRNKRLLDQIQNKTISLPFNCEECLDDSPHHMLYVLSAPVALRSDTIKLRIRLYLKLTTGNKTNQIYAFFNPIKLFIIALTIATIVGVVMYLVHSSLKLALTFWIVSALFVLYITINRVKKQLYKKLVGWLKEL